MKIAVINTGGTISCVGDPLAPMSAEAFASASQLILDPILQQQLSRSGDHLPHDHYFSRIGFTHP
ncbi:hypothetical protein P4S72_17340 [Vibrio sp. PP-XX7]